MNGQKATVLLSSALFVLGGFLLVRPSDSPLRIGQVPPRVVLQGEDGGQVDGKPFSTDILKGKVWYFVYVDPDVRDYNEGLNEKLKAKHFPAEKFGSVAVINMEATWIPNFVLSRMLAEKQRKYPRTIYVKDYNRVFVKKWGLKDDNYNILIFDWEGKLRYWGWGDLPPHRADAVVQLIEKLVQQCPCP